MDLLRIHTSILYKMAEDLSGGPEGWAINRLIFRDWWHWKDHELQAALGNIALTGQNESGKSSLLALAATLLDGDTTPRRLDPSLSPDRYLHYFLLGKGHDHTDNPEVFSYRARVGYVVLEFRLGRDGRYLTIGMGVDASQAVQGRMREWWGFIISGRRFGYDFDVRDKDGICLGLQDFRQISALEPVVDGEGDVPPNATVVTTKRNIYRQQVNNRLFKMDDDDYRALIESLVSARRPKIVQATQEGPEKVCELLRDSLPPLSGDQMDNLSAVINNLEIHQRNLKDLEDQAEMVEKIDHLHYALVEALVQQAAQEYSSQIGYYGNVMGRLHKAEKQRNEAGAAIAEQEGNIRDMEISISLARAELAAQRVDVKELPEKINQAKIREKNAYENYRFIGDNLDRVNKDIEGAKNDRSRIQRDFEEARHRIVLRLDGYAGAAHLLGWAEAAEMLRRSCDDTRSLDSAGPINQVLAAAPDSAHLIGKSQEMVDQCSVVLDGLKVKKEKEQAFWQQEQELEKLRQEWQKAVDNAARAEGSLAGEKESLLEALEKWQDGHPELELPDHRVAAVRGAVLDLQEVPEYGHHELVQPLRKHAGDRRAELQSGQLGALTRAEAIGRDIEGLDGEINGLTEKGLQPQRSAIRNIARTEASDVRSMYEWVRFRPAVDSKVATLVEAALLEAGVLDLAVPEGNIPDTDAWLWASRPASGPSLAMVMEPEEGAPRLVEAALAAIGWGVEQGGDHWVTPDGRWRHGLAEGQVAPWLQEAPGLVGAERRQRTLAERINRLQEAKQEAEARKMKALAEAGLFQAALESVDQALIQLDQLRWQALFSGIHVLEDARAVVERAKQALETARPLADEARKAFEAATSQYQEMLRKAPFTTGRNEKGLDQLIDDLKEFSQNIHMVSGAYEGLEGLMKDCRLRSDRIDELDQSYREWKIRQSATKLEYEAAQAEVAALDLRINNPDVSAALAARQRLEAEIERIDKDISNAKDNRDKQKIVQGVADRLMEGLVPDVQKAWQLRDEKRTLLMNRLTLHPDFAGEASRLADEAEHKPGSLGSLPSLLEGIADLQEEIEERRAGLMDWFRKVADDLVDYRPTPSKTFDCIAFFDETRQELTPRELYHRLVTRQERTRGLIDEGERNLYEEIICNDLLDDLIDLMNEAQDFRVKMNRKLEGLKSSSGAYFSFKLDLRDESAPGVRVGRALAELDLGVTWLTGDQRRHLAKLIRDEVERARQESQAQNKTVGYLEAIQSTLDYRQWYRFRLFSHEPGHKPEPIKNKGFGTRSMFGRSWALAVPIIAGVAARYDAARDPDVPRIVFLDEVFAGFDPKNQATYLRYLKALNLNWMITSPEDMPYSDLLPAVMSYQMYLSGTTHTAYPSLWDGQKVTDPSELTGQMLELGVAGKKEKV